MLERQSQDLQSQSQFDSSAFDSEASEGGISLPPRPFALTADDPGDSSSEQSQEQGFSQENNASVNEMPAPQGMKQSPDNDQEGATNDEKEEELAPVVEQEQAIQESTDGEGGGDGSEGGSGEQPAGDSTPNTPPAENPSEAGGDSGDSSAGGGGGGEAGGGGMGAGGGGEAGGFSAETASLDTSSMGGVVKSLGKEQPTTIVATMGQAGGALNTAKTTETDKIKSELPEFEQPTGLGTTMGEGPSVENNLKEGQEPELKVPEGENVQEQVNQGPKPIEGPNPADQISTPPKEAISNPSGFKSAVQSLPETDQTIDTSAGPRPQVKLQGDINPVKNEKVQSNADADIQAKKQVADLESSKDFKEGEIMPSVEKEMMKVETELGGGSSFTSTAQTLPEMNPETATALNQGILAEYNDELSGEMGKQSEAENEYNTNMEKEQSQTMEKIAEENEKIKQQQIEEKAKGSKEIDKHRAEWKAENEKVNAEFKNKSSKERSRIEGQIQAKVSETNQKVESEFSKAEAEARAKTDQSSRDIQKKKAEAKKKEEDKSWWEKAVDAVSSFFEGLKKAVSAIFDALKKAVSAIIDVAKQLASQLIDMARKAIKTLIDSFAEVLKGFIKIALAAFPELAERFCNMIDSVVETIKSGIDVLADALKATVNFLLDALGTVVNALLSAYEAILNAILSAIEAYILIWIKIMRGIANLVSAAMGSPSQFFGQVSEELLGQDVTAPLQNEYPAMADMPAQQAVTPADIDMGDMPSMVPDAPDQTQELLSRTSYSEGDFQVPALDNIIFDPAMVSQLEDMGDGEFNIGEFDSESHGIDALKEELGWDPQQQMSGELGGEEVMGQEQVAQAAPVVSTPMDPSRDRFTPDGQGMVGPFSVGERARFTSGQMMTGIKTWFSENWPTIIAALIGIIGGGILANILTGGAIMAALPLIMQLVGAYFAADAVIRATKYFGGYLGKAFPGDIPGGAKSLARALAIGAIELVFALMFGAKGAFKAAKGAAKTVAKQGVKGAMKTGVKTAATAAKNGVKSTGKAALQLGKVAKNGAKTAGKNMVKGGKFVMNGMKRGALSGAKSLDDVAKRLGKAFKFKKFKIAIKNRKFRLLGKINPWILLGSGELEFHKASDIGSSKVGNRVSITRNVDGVDEVVDGIVVGKKNTQKLGGVDDYSKLGKNSTDGYGTSSYVENLLDLAAKGDQKALQDIFQQLDEAGTGAGSIIRGGGEAKVLDRIRILVEEGTITAKQGEDLIATFKQRSSLRKNLGTGVGDEAHHLLPVDLLDHPMIRKALDDGFQFHNVDNGLNASKYSSKTNPSGIHASHPQYTENIRSILTQLDDAALGIPKNILVEELAKTVRTNAGKFATGGKGNLINNLFDFVSKDDIITEVLTNAAKRASGK